MDLSTKMEDLDDNTEAMAVDSPPVNDIESNEAMEEDDFSEHARPRKRTRRACDKCSASRTRCNGECPCRRCEDYGYTCRYNREVKKRGRVPISMAGGGGGASVHSDTGVANLGRRQSLPGNGRSNHSYPHRASFSNGHSYYHGGATTASSPSIASPPSSLHGIGTSGPTTIAEAKQPHFASGQRANSYSEPAAGPGPGRPPLHTSHSNNGLSHKLSHGHRVGGPTTNGPMLPGISTVPGLSSLPVPSPSYLVSPGASGSYSAGGVHSHMQLASLLDPTATLDQHHPSGSSILGPASQQGSTALPRIFPQQQQQQQSAVNSGTSPAGVPSSVSGSQAPDLPLSDESAGYPSPAAGGGATSGAGGHIATSGEASVSFSSGTGLPGMRPGTHDSSGSGGGNSGLNRSSFSTTTTAATSGAIGSNGGVMGEIGGLPELQRVSSLYKAPSADCRYRCLMPVVPYLRDIIPASVACDLLDVYLTEPGSSLFRCASPYILTRIFRKKSLLHPTNPRPTTPALLATMLWCAAQTADIVLLHVPGSRAKICNALYELSTALVSERDPDRWRRIHGGLRVEKEQQPQTPYSYLMSPESASHHHHPTTTATNEPAGVVDDVLTFILLSIAVSGGDFKSDCFKWWSKAVRLTIALGLNREDERCSASVSPCANPLCSCRRDQESSLTVASAEAREERRRVFWLIYCLDRHLALSFNNVLYIPDSYCEVFAPLPESVWEDLDFVSPRDCPERVLGPPTIVTGTGFFEYFLPLMAILGDIIEVHHRRHHTRLGGLDDAPAIKLIGDQLAACERSLERLAHEVELLELSSVAAVAGGSTSNEYLATPTAASAPPAAASTPGPHIKDLVTGCLPTSAPSPSTAPPPAAAQVTPPATVEPATTTTASGAGAAASAASQVPPRRYRASTRDRSRLQLVTAYSTHILHVLHVLLYGKWDAISMLDDDDDWITSTRFNDCATHAIAASQAVSRILKHDPELTFMPYLFGIYLLHGSFILLLFADRMPALGGPNQSVEQACETIVRAHEVCVVTLSTEFQKNFRKVLRSTLYSVRGSSPTEWEEHKARRRALSLYRWTRGARGLAL